MVCLCNGLDLYYAATVVKVEKNMKIFLFVFGLLLVAL